jgi:hypothetical protein
MTFFVFLAFLALTLSRGFCVLSSLLLALSSMLFVNQTNQRNCRNHRNQTPLEINSKA